MTLAGGGTCVMCVGLLPAAPVGARFLLSLKDGCQGPTWCRGPSPASGCSHGCFPLSQGGRSGGHVWLAFPLAAPPAGIGVGFWEKGLWVQGTEAPPANPSQWGERRQGNLTGSLGNWNIRIQACSLLLRVLPLLMTPGQAACLCLS